MGADPWTGGEGSTVPPAPPWATPPAAEGHRRVAAAAWRGPLALVLLVVGCAAAPLALCAAYVHTSIMDTEGYVAAVAPLASDPAVQDAVAEALSERIGSALEEAGSSSSPLPEELGALTEGLVGALPVEELTREFTVQALGSPAFASVWEKANRAAHPLLVDAVEKTGDDDETTDPLFLDLAGVTATVTDKLRDAGVPMPDPLPEALRSGDVRLLDLQQVQRLGRLIVTLDRLWLALVALAVLALAGCVAVSRDRLRAAVLTGAGLVIAMAALEAALAVVRGSYLDHTDTAHIPHAASAAVFDTVTRSLRSWGWSVLIVGASLVVAGLLVAWSLARRPAR